jgi:hypothetical protein
VSAAIKPQSYLPPNAVAFDKPSAPEGRTRCKDLLLDGECASCLGLPDIEFIVEQEDVA